MQISSNECLELQRAVASKIVALQLYFSDRAVSESTPSRKPNETWCARCARVAARDRVRCRTNLHCMHAAADPCRFSLADDFLVGSWMKGANPRRGTVYIEGDASMWWLSCGEPSPQTVSFGSDDVRRLCILGNVQRLASPFGVWRSWPTSNDVEPWREPSCRNCCVSLESRVQVRTCGEMSGRTVQHQMHSW